MENGVSAAAPVAIFNESKLIWAVETAETGHRFP